MRAAILSIGDELTSGQVPEANARWLAAQLAEQAVTTVELRVVGDDRTAIAAAFRELAARADVLLSTGGIGPTADDLTRAALCDVLTHDTRPLVNPRGTALGIAGRLDRCRIYVMPGPPAEMRTMYRDQVLPELDLPSEVVRVTGQVHAFGLGESAADERLGPISDRSRRPKVGVTHSESIVTARIEADGAPRDASRALEETRSAILRAWEPYAYGVDDETLAVAVGGLLRARGLRLATAESCTGGGLGKLIVDAAGASDYYLGGWVTYSDDLKRNGLDVPADLIGTHGAVSEPVARAMATGALAASGADEALAVTGIAGPAGGTQGKDVGTVFIGHARRGTGTVVRRFRFPGGRDTVRDRAAKSALQLLRFALLGRADSLDLLWEVTRETSDP